VTFVSPSPLLPFSSVHDSKRDCNLNFDLRSNASYVLVEGQRTDKSEWHSNRQIIALPDLSESQMFVSLDGGVPLVNDDREFDKIAETIKAIQKTLRLGDLRIGIDNERFRIMPGTRQQPFGFFDDWATYFPTSRRKSRRFDATKRYPRVDVSATISSSGRFDGKPSVSTLTARFLGKQSSRWPTPRSSMNLKCATRTILLYLSPLVGPSLGFLERFPIELLRHQ
jgi:hypothetical protein